MVPVVPDLPNDVDGVESKMKTFSSTSEGPSTHEDFMAAHSAYCIPSE